MNKFELDDKRIKRELIDLGIGNKKADEMIELIKSSYNLGNEFPKLSEDSAKKVKSLNNKRVALINEYKRLAWLLKPLIEEESKVRDELDNVSDEICMIQGHRLSADPVPLIDYNHGLILADGYARICVICGKVINKEDMLDNDIVVTDKVSYPKRILYKR